MPKVDADEPIPDGLSAHKEAEGQEAAQSPRHDDAMMPKASTIRLKSKPNSFSR